MDEVLTDMADNAGIPYSGAANQDHPDPVVDRNVTGDYLFTWETTNGEYLRFKIADVGFARGEMLGFVSVQYKKHKSDKPKTLLSRKRWIFESNSSTGQQLTALNRWKGIEVDWPAIMTWISTYFEDNYETGDPLVWLDEVDNPGEIEYLVTPLLQKDQHTLVGARKGSMKSMTALAICLTLATCREIIPGIKPVSQQPIKSIYCDYETSKTIHRRRLAMLAKAKGIEIPRQMIAYKRLTSPMVHQKAELQRTIAIHGIGFGVTDSVGRASGGETVGEADVQNYYNAVSAFGVTWLSLGHPAKAGDSVVAGNAQWEYQARSVWKFEAAKEHGSNSLVIGMHHAYVNEGELSQSLNYHASFGNEAVSYAVADDADIQQLEGTDLKTQIRIFLGENPNSTIKQIAEGLDKTDQRIRNILNTHADSLWVSDNQWPAKWVLNPVYKPPLDNGGTPPTGVYTPPVYRDRLEQTRLELQAGEENDDPLPEF